MDTPKIRLDERKKRLMEDFYFVAVTVIHSINLSEIEKLS